MAAAVTYRKVTSIEGWLSATDYEIFRRVLDCQQERDVQGAIAEIGVHHGKSFVPLAAFSGASKLYAIDVFGAQDKNIDQSGKGDRETFLNNLKRFSVDLSRLRIDARMSGEVTPADIRNTVGPVRFFHIDGGHHFDAVTSDIRLAVEALAEGGVIAVDDVFRPEWPEVSIAAFCSKEFVAKDIALFAIGFNKSYFSRRAHVHAYQEALAQSDFLAAHLTRVYRPKDDRILVFQRYPLPEWSARQIAYWMMSVYAPYSYASFRAAIAKLKQRLGRSP